MPARHGDGSLNAFHDEGLRLSQDSPDIGRVAVGVRVKVAVTAVEFAMLSSGGVVVWSFEVETRTAVRGVRVGNTGY